MFEKLKRKIKKWVLSELIKKLKDRYFDAYFEDEDWKITDEDKDVVIQFLETRLYELDFDSGY